MNALESAKVTVDNESGISVYSNLLKKDFTGTLSVNLSSYSAGLYLVKVLSEGNQYVYKIMLTK